MADQNDTVSIVELAADLTAAWLSNPNTRANAEDVPAFLQAIHAAVAGLAGAPGADASEEAAQPAAEHKAAVSVRKSLANPDHIISMIDGKPYRSLTRHLSANGLTPAEYRQRYGLKADYPMTAPSYSEQRRAMAKKIGLGRKPGQKRGARKTATEASEG
ncbi:MucR family transcriptional regulator [Sphingomonas aracearum]|uniref:Transcriptional regulator n=1 Tax=Sphingomonas aracearum TaxID=2283317 RepID=A0A369VWZ7_9SPHN|nr:MucR family transcriptional regulator [Sphingomonas aracearum]RDE06145.1 transcriptional regulator [Sphingomonas aracearum]